MLMRTLHQHVVDVTDQKSDQLKLRGITASWRIDQFNQPSRDEAEGCIDASVWDDGATGKKQ